MAGIIFKQLAVLATYTLSESLRYGQNAYTKTGKNGLNLLQITSNIIDLKTKRKKRNPLPLLM